MQQVAPSIRNALVNVPLAATLRVQKFFNVTDNVLRHALLEDYTVERPSPPRIAELAPLGPDCRVQHQLALLALQSKVATLGQQVVNQCSVLCQCSQSHQLTRPRLHIATTYNLVGTALLLPFHLPPNTPPLKIVRAPARLVLKPRLDCTVRMLLKLRAHSHLPARPLPVLEHPLHEPLVRLVVRRQLDRGDELATGVHQQLLAGSARHCGRSADNQ